MPSDFRRPNEEQGVVMQQAVTLIQALTRFRPAGKQSMTYAEMMEAIDMSGVSVAYRPEQVG